MKKITNQKLINILEHSMKENGVMLNDIRNIGNPRLALVETWAYAGDNGSIIIYSKMNHGGISFRV